MTSPTDAEVLRARILDLSEEYARLVHGPKPFSPGQLLSEIVRIAG